MIFGGLEKCTLIDYPNVIACMVYTIGCNFRCPYCHNPELVDETVENTLTESDFFDFLESRNNFLDGVVITGGEPTVHGEDLLHFMKEVKGRGFKVKLDSNGTNPHILRRAFEDGLVDYTAMDIKSPLRKYSQTVSRPVNVDAIRESIELIMSSGIEYEFRTTIVKALLSPVDIEEIGKEIAGAKKYFLQKFIPTKLLNPQFLRKVTYTDHEFRQFQLIMQNYVTHCGIR